MNVVGLDLSTKRIGFAAADGQLLSISGHAGAEDPYRRLHELTRELARAFRVRPPGPDLVVVEDYALGAPGRLSLVRLGEIGGIVRTWLFEQDWPIVLVSPSSVKRFATGNGNATKEAMISRAIELGARGNVNDDEADAFHLRRMARAAHGLEGILLGADIDCVREVLSGYDETELLQLNALSGSGADNERAEALLDDLFACLPTS